MANRSTYSIETTTRVETVHRACVQVGTVTRITPSLNKHARTLCRRVAGVARRGAPPVVLVPGSQPPTLEGHSWHYTTRTGKPVYHPSAYGRVGWSSLVYHSSTRRVEVGRDWRPA